MDLEYYISLNNNSIIHKLYYFFLFLSIFLYLGIWAVF